MTGEAESGDKYTGDESVECKSSQSEQDHRTCLFDAGSHKECLDLGAIGRLLDDFRSWRHEGSRERGDSEISLSRQHILADTRLTARVR